MWILLKMYNKALILIKTYVEIQITVTLNNKYYNYYNYDPY